MKTISSQQSTDSSQIPPYPPCLKGDKGGLLNHDSRLKEVKEAGADGIALISAIFTAENIKKTTEEFLRFEK